MAVLDQKFLLAHKLAQFKKSSNLRCWQLFWQFASVAPAFASVFIGDENRVALHLLGFAGTLFVLVQVRCSYKCFVMRSAAHALRRRVLLSTFLPLELSQCEVVATQRYLLIDDRKTKSCAPEKYYDNDAGVGRLGLLLALHESILFSHHLHKRSAVFLFCWFLAPLGLISILLMALSPLLSQEGLMLSVRIWLLLVVLFSSVDVLGAYLLHRAAASELADLHLRVAAIDRNGSETSSVLTCFLDYCSTIESAPEIIPGLFDDDHDLLASRWSSLKK